MSVGLAELWEIITVGPCVIFLLLHAKLGATVTLWYPSVTSRIT